VLDGHIYGGGPAGRKECGKGGAPSEDHRTDQIPNPISSSSRSTSNRTAPQQLRVDIQGFG
jgi:hypothetical protein